MNGKTRILVTHALDCVAKCDWVILLSWGKIVFDGVYSDLVNTEYFKRIEKSLDSAHNDDLIDSENEEKKEVEGHDINESF